jgi:hypothetical protein
MIGVDSYKKALDQIKAAKNSFDTTHKKSLAPVISSLFVSKFNKKLAENLRKFINGDDINVLESRISTWEASFEKIVDKSAESALKELLTSTSTKNSDIFGTYYKHLKEWQAYVEGNTFTRNKFLEIIKSKINLDKIKNIVRDNLEEIKLKLNNKDVLSSYWVGNMISTSSQTGQIGGSVNEFINQLLQSSIPEDVEINSHNRAALTFRNSMQKIDNVLILSFNANIDTQNIVERLDNDIAGTTDLIDAEELMSDYWNNNLKNLKDTFVVFSSGKAYGLTDYNIQGFHNDENRSIKELPEVFSKGITPMNQRKAEEFIEVVENAIPGAVLDDNQALIKTILRDRIYESMAYLLFDDWVAIGNEAGDGTAIHSFTLNGINIPLSYLLIGAGRAIRKANSSSNSRGGWFNVSISYPKELLYKSSKDYPEEGTSEKPDVLKAWENQRQVALDSIRFTNHFLANFYSLVLNEYEI